MWKFTTALRVLAIIAAPRELQALGKVLQKVMLGDKNVDLSSLPEGWREMIEKELSM